MIENLPSYVSVAFILTTFLTVGFLFYSIRQLVSATNAAKILFALVPLWLIFQAALASSGFFLSVDTFPPRLPLFAVVPALVLIVLLFIFARKDVISRLPLKILTVLHVVRIPVEIVLLWLFQNGQIPQLMTFEGRNFDILSGLSAPIIAWLAFRSGKTNRPLLIVWNIFALLLLINVVTNAVLSIPSPIQQMAFEQPNRAVLYFPFVWLPAVVVPIVLFSHLVSFWQLFSKNK